MYIYHHHHHSKPNHRIMKYAQMFRKPPQNKYSHTSINYRYSQRPGKSKKYRHSNQNASFESKPNYSVTKKPWQPTENVLNPIKHAYFNYVTNGRTLAGSLNTNHFRASNYYRSKMSTQQIAAAATGATATGAKAATGATAGDEVAKGTDIPPSQKQLNRRSVGIVRKNTPAKLQLKKDPPALVVNCDGSMSNCSSLYTQTSSDSGDNNKMLLQTHWNWERCTVSVRGYNELLSLEQDTNYRFSRPMNRDQVVVRFSPKGEPTAFRTPTPNDMSKVEWEKLRDLLPDIYKQLKRGKHFKKQLIPFKSQHVSSSQHMGHDSKVRSYVTINRNYKPAYEDEWHFGRASCTLNIVDFKLLKNNAANIDLAVQSLDRQFQRAYDNMLYISVVKDSGFSSDSDDSDMTDTEEDEEVEEEEEEEEEVEEEEIEFEEVGGLDDTMACTDGTLTIAEETNDTPAKNAQNVKSVENLLVNSLNNVDTPKNSKPPRPTSLRTTRGEKLMSQKLSRVKPY